MPLRVREDWETDGKAPVAPYRQRTSEEMLGAQLSLFRFGTPAFWAWCIGSERRPSVGTHLWKSYCESVMKNVEQDIRSFDAALETIAATKKFLEFDGKLLERRHRRFRAAMYQNAKH